MTLIDTNFKTNQMAVNPQQSALIRTGEKIVMSGFLLRLRDMGGEN